LRAQNPDKNNKPLILYLKKGERNWYFPRWLDYSHGPHLFDAIIDIIRHCCFHRCLIKTKGLIMIIYPVEENPFSLVLHDEDDDDDDDGDDVCCYFSPPLDHITKFWNPYGLCYILHNSF